jgi:diamine N-acetyltransferase
MLEYEEAIKKMKSEGDLNMNIKKTESKSVYLRSLELSDLERAYKWHNDAALYEFVMGTFRYTSRASEEDWLRKMQSYSTQEVNLAICLTSNSEHIGNIYIRHIDWVARHGRLTGVIIGDPDQRSKGYGQAALHLLIKHAFRDLGLLRLWGFVLEEHMQSIRMLENCGFVVEGKLHKHAFKGGELKDVLVMGILR